MLAEALRSHLPCWLDFIMENEQSGHISNGYFSSPPSQNQGDFAPVFTVRIWWGSLEVKLTKVWGLLRLGPHEFLILKLVHTQSPAFHQRYLLRSHLNVPTSSWLQWLLVNCDSVFSCLYSLRGWGVVL